MAKRRVTVDSDHLTLVVRKTLLGLRHHVQMVSNYKEGIEEIVMTTERYSTVGGAKQSAKRLSKQLNIKVVVED